MEKQGEIRFADLKLKESFEELNDSDKEFYKEIQDAMNEISKNVFCGRNVKKELIPKEYIQKYNLNNLWIYNLRDGWRLFLLPPQIKLMFLLLFLTGWTIKITKDYLSSK